MARKSTYAARLAKPRPAAARRRQGASPSAVGASRGLAGGVFAAGGLALAPSASAPAPVLLLKTWSGSSGGPRLAPRSGLPHRFGDVALFPSAPRGVQAAWKVSRPGDRHEREAERVAAAVLSMPAPRNGRRKPPAARKEQAVLPAREGAAPSPGATPALESQLRAKGGGGKALPARERAFFEPRFGHDFSQVRIHDDARSARMARSLNARAFTVGRDVHFAKGQYQPQSSAGKRLLAHELTHTLQQGAHNLNGTKAYRREQDSETQPAKEKPSDLEARLDKITQTYRAMIRNARKDGNEVAATNLERFLVGTGGVRKISVSWLRDYSAVTDAEEKNQDRFESSLTKLGYKLNAGEKRSFSDYWDRLIKASVFTELYYASGNSTLTSRGRFSLERKSKDIDITGVVDHHWWDPYDWHKGLSAYVPGHGVISDKDALLLQKHRGAKPFRMKSDWKQTVKGKIEIIDWWPDSVNYYWKGP